MTRVNEFGQPIGRPVDWSPRQEVAPVVLEGRYSRVEPLAAHHLDGLYDALVLRTPASSWTYMSGGPFTDKPGLFGWLRMHADDPGMVPHTLCLDSGRPVGVATFLRLDGHNGSVEVGAIILAAELQRTRAATELMYLMMRHVFDDLGYRRYEWKCDSLNGPSRRAAERLGFRYEGRFRNAMVYKGRNRDTDWLSIIDEEWPEVKARLEAWLAPENFDADGNQISALSTSQP